jgi:hypothetical protein
VARALSPFFLFFARASKVNGGRERIDVEQESGNKTFTRKEGSNGFFYYITGEKRKKERLARWGVGV